MYVPTNLICYHYFPLNMFKFNCFDTVNQNSVVEFSTGDYMIFFLWSSLSDMINVR